MLLNPSETLFCALLVNRAFLSWQTYWLETCQLSVLYTETDANFPALLLNISKISEDIISLIHSDLLGYFAVPWEIGFVIF